MGVMDWLKKYQTPIIWVGAILLVAGLAVKYYSDKITGWFDSLKGAY